MIVRGGEGKARKRSFCIADHKFYSDGFLVFLNRNSLGKKQTKTRKKPPTKQNNFLKTNKTKPHLMILFIYNAIANIFIPITHIVLYFMFAYVIRYFYYCRLLTCLLSLPDSIYLPATGRSCWCRNSGTWHAGCDRRVCRANSAGHDDRGEVWGRRHIATQRELGFYMYLYFSPPWCTVSPFFLFQHI